MGDVFRVAALCALLPSCFLVVTEERVHDVRRQVRRNAPTPMTPPVAAFAVQPRAGGLDIHATWRRQCSITSDRIIDQRVETGATVELYGSCSDCLYVYIFSILAAPATLLVSGIVTGIRVARTDDRFVTKVEPLPLEHGVCDEPAANVRLVVTPPAGEPTVIVTDAAGRGRAENLSHATVQIAP